MYLISEIFDDNKKANIASKILRSLPEWFGIEESIVEYVEGVKGRDFYVATEYSIPVGFISLKRNSKVASEIYVMGILKEYHKRGIGKMLLEMGQERLKIDNYKFLMVKTLSDAHPDKYYKKTREFYSKVGFHPLEEIKEIWGEENPCLIMIKAI